MQKLMKRVLTSCVLYNQKRFLPRWNHRKPIRVYSAEEYDQLEKKSDNVSGVENVFDKYGGVGKSFNKLKIDNEGKKDSIGFKIKSKKLAKPLVATTQKSKVKSKNDSCDMLETVLDSEGNFIYTKMKNNDQRVGTILTEVKSKKEKVKKDLILLEGKRLIKDALQSNALLKYILFSRKNELEYLKEFLPRTGAKLYKMPYREMQIWSDLTTTPGIMAIFKIPNVESFTPINPLPLTIICDNVREPGNLGTILRICAAVNCAKVILTKGCVNLWDTKVLRSAIGAHFKLQIHKSQDWGQIRDLIDENANVFIADNNKTDVLEKIPLLAYHKVDFLLSKHLVLIIGGETEGISQKSYDLAVNLNGARLIIPLSNNIDSLNVGAALGIIVFEIKRQLNK